MDENRFDEVIRDLPQSFNNPPEPPLDEMWAVIESAHFNSPAAIPPSGAMTSRAPWLAVAAALVIGVGIGHYAPFGKKTAPNVAVANARYYEGRYLAGIAAGNFPDSPRRFPKRIPRSISRMRDCATP